MSEVTFERVVRWSLKRAPATAGLFLTQSPTMIGVVITATGMFRRKSSEKEAPDRGGSHPAVQAGAITAETIGRTPRKCSNRNRWESVYG